MEIFSSVLFLFRDKIQHVRLCFDSNLTKLETKLKSVQDIVDFYNGGEILLPLWINIGNADLGIQKWDTQMDDTLKLKQRVPIRKS